MHILKLGPDEDLDEVETCRPHKNSTPKIYKMCLTDVILISCLLTHQDGYR